MTSQNSQPASSRHATMHEDFADRLMSDERRRLQDPKLIVDQLGLRPGVVVADLGCGPGFFTIPIALKIGNVGRVYAVDSSPMMLSHLNRNIRESHIVENVVRVVQADVSHTSIPSRSVDLVFFADILHDIEDRVGFLTEVKRISKTRAAVVDIDWLKVETDFGPPLKIRLSEEDARRIMTMNGFRVTRTISAGLYHYGLVCTPGA
jgi:ubiquinone/menaquinone biosynthesis C-methylase UbiE